MEIDYDPKRISFRQLIEFYAAQPDVHVPSWSRQYRSAIFYHNDEQRRTAKDILAHAEGVHVDLEPYGVFTNAEDYHQKFYLQNSALMTEYKHEFPDFRHFVNSTAAARANGYISGHGKAQDIQLNLPGLGLSRAGQQTLIDRSRKPGLRCGS